MAIEDVMTHKSFKGKQTTLNHKMDIRILIDRFAVTDDEENRKRIADSVLTAFSESEGECYVQAGQKKEVYFNNRFELDGMEFLEPSHQLFNYNNPYGACPRCEGYGRMLGIDPEKVIPDDSLSLYEEAIACWRGEKGKEWLNQLVRNAHKFDFPVHKPYRQLTQAQQNWCGKATPILKASTTFSVTSRARPIKSKTASSWRATVATPPARSVRVADSE